MQLTLLDGEHAIGKASLYTLELMADNGVDVFDPETAQRFSNPRELFDMLPAILAAFLSASEPVDANGDPKKLWTPAQVKRLIPLDKVDELSDVLLSAVGASMPDEDAQAKGAATRP